MNTENEKAPEKEQPRSVSEEELRRALEIEYEASGAKTVDDRIRVLREKHEILDGIARTGGDVPEEDALKYDLAALEALDLYLAKLAEPRRSNQFPPPEFFGPAPEPSES